MISRLIISIISIITVLLGVITYSYGQKEPLDLSCFNENWLVKYKEDKRRPLYSITNKNDVKNGWFTLERVRPIPLEDIVIKVNDFGNDRLVDIEKDGILMVLSNCLYRINGVEFNGAVSVQEIGSERLSHLSVGDEDQSRYEVQPHYEIQSDYYTGSFLIGNGKETWGGNFEIKSEYEHILIDFIDSIKGLSTNK